MFLFFGFRRHQIITPSMVSTRTSKSKANGVLAPFVVTQQELFKYIFLFTKIEEEEGEKLALQKLATNYLL